VTGPLRAALAALLALAAVAPPRALAAAPTGPRIQAEIALLGTAIVVEPVRDVLSELLEREGVDAVFTWPQRLNADDIFSAPGSSRAAIAVWIDLLTSPGEARLYFRDAGARRFVVRRVPLRRESEEIAREEIAHIVASAVLALNAGNGATLTLTQAREAIKSITTAAPKDDDDDNDDGSRRAQPEPRRGGASPSGARAASSTVVWETSASVTAQVLAREIPVAPRFDVSFGVVDRSVGAWLSAGYQLPATDTGSVGVTLRAMALRAGLLWDVHHFGAATLRVWAGVGADRVDFQPRGDDPHVALAPGGEFWTPAGRLAIGVRFGHWEHLALEGAVVGDLSLADVHYDIQDAQGFTQRVLAPLVMRPGASIGAVWRF
jgi:hypothetical protein